ncbi:UDP-N-acetylmuramate--L-alanine ligase [Rhabdobacter roseus]|uniref:UDP-N-acetylmuramate--L-alanine ligase n=1 Tax=Rhabdobacter roseus TaxID=1655419 RepID=A0A840TX70_9BACT|nr:UDP-N-acetylmuramate--L-alanine ligase [Rhabdobacter roseus]MBB5284808.1 UDP-N-acetylmuramate--alanine ligase [Rhabdobacter roseus]
MSFDTSWKYVYFIGVGGIGMSALARWFCINGFAVAGYDRTPTTLTGALQKEGVRVSFEDRLSAIPAEFLADPSQTLVVYTPAIPADHQGLAYFRANGFTMQKRSQVLGWLTQALRTVGIAGTHGKTTTSSMVAHLLRQAGVNCTAFLGGITQNYGTNFLLNEPTDDPESIVCVVEADEFDRSFLTLHPAMAIVTSTDADHLDIYGEHETMLESFRAFVGQISPEGVLFMRKGLALADSTRAQVLEYGLREGDYHSDSIRIEKARFVFDIVYPTGIIKDISMKVPGYHNLENAVGATAVALQLGVTPEQVKEGLGTYSGVKRRFEFHLETDDQVLIDDYAHHPTEIEAFLGSVRALFPQRHITAIFQPHLFSRTRDFADGFAQSLSLADRLLLLDIYPAREQPLPGVTSAMLLNLVTLEDKRICSKDELVEKLRTLETDIVVTIGAGDIDQLVEPIKKTLLHPFTN